MKPQSLDSHCSAKPVRYALEMNQGWFAKRGIGPGVSHQRPRRQAVRDALSAARRAQAKFFAAKSQLTSLSKKVSTYFWRRLR